MGNCTSYETDEEQPQIPYRQQSDFQRDDNVVQLLDNPKLTFNSDLQILNDGNVYGGKIYIGHMSGQQVFCKLIHKHQERAMEREMKTLLGLKHTNIAKILFKVDLEEHKFILVTEDYGKCLTESVERWSANKKQIMRQLVEAISYLQSMKIVHLELSPRNIYIMDNRNLIVKLTNFHKALEMKNDNGLKYTFTNYTEGYAAPEICDPQKCYLSSDIYSLGCVFFYILTNGLEMHQMKCRNQRQQVSSRLNMLGRNNCSAFIMQGKDLIEKMLIFEHNKRISAQEASEHPFFWRVEKTTMFIIEASKLTEKDAQYRSVLFKGGKRVISGDWVKKIDVEAINKLQEIRQAYQAKTGANQEDFDGKNILSLVRTIRNILVHAPNDEICRIMGHNDEEFIKYWNDKFPLLILHLYKSKLLLDRN